MQLGKSRHFQTHVGAEKLGTLFVRLPHEKTAEGSWATAARMIEVAGRGTENEARGAEAVTVQIG